MSAILSLQEMKQHYPNEWLLIAYTELDDEMGVKYGKVLVHSPNRDDVYAALLSMQNQFLAIEYTGDIPQDWAVVL